MDYRDLFIQQAQMIRSWIAALGLSHIRLKEREADDVLYRLTCMAREEGLTSIIVSDDKDFFQLLRDDVHIFRPMAEQYVTPESFRTEYGFSPRRYLLFKAMCGDPSDKVKGIMGVGEKTAAEIVKHCSKRKQLPKWCTSHQGGRLNFKAAGADVAQPILRRNLELFDLRLEDFDDEEMRRIVKAYRRRIPRDMDALTLAAKEMHFDTIAGHMGLWISPLRWQDGKRKHPLKKHSDSDSA